MAKHIPLSPENAAIFERIKHVTGVQNGNQLAKYLGINAASVHAGLHGHIPDTWLFKVAALEQCSVEYLRRGTGLIEDETGLPFMEWLRVFGQQWPTMTRDTRQLLLQCAELCGDAEAREFIRAQFAMLQRRPRRPRRPRHPNA